MSRRPTVRLLPNVVTVLALSAGLSAVYFTLDGRHEFAIGAVVLAALLDGLDGRLARMLDATSRVGAELDSLADAMSFGVAPAIVLFVWRLQDAPAGWPIALVFAICTVLRLARFNTLLDATNAPPYTKEFFVGVPAPFGGLLALLPLIVALQFGSGWWSSWPAVAVWTLLVASTLVSRIPTLSLKTLKVPPKAVAPVLIGVGVAAAGLITVPLLVLLVAAVVYLAHVPYAVYRHRWLARHPSAWEAPPAQRRVIRRTARDIRRLRPQPPLRRRVAGAAARAGAAVRRAANNGKASGAVQIRHRPRSWRRLGLRRSDRQEP